MNAQPEAKAGTRQATVEQKELGAAVGFWIVGLVVIAVAIGLAAWLAEDIWEQEAYLWDSSIMLAVHTVSARWLDYFMLAVTYIGSPGGIVVAAVVAFWLWRRGQIKWAVALLVSYGGAALLSAVLKLTFMRPRPTVFPALLAPRDPSFPSGHTLTSIALYGFIAWLLWQHRRRVWAVLAVLFALLVAFSRVYLGVHYPSDILGALLVGIAWLGVVILGCRAYDGYDRRRSERPDDIAALPPPDAA